MKHSIKYLTPLILPLILLVYSCRNTNEGYILEKDNYSLSFTLNGVEQATYNPHSLRRSISIEEYPLDKDNILELSIEGSPQRRDGIPYIEPLMDGSRCKILIYAGTDQNKQPLIRSKEFIYKKNQPITIDKLQRGKTYLYYIFSNGSKESLPETKNEGDNSTLEIINKHNNYAYNKGEIKIEQQNIERKINLESVTSKIVFNIKSPTKIKEIEGKFIKDVTGFQYSAKLNSFKYEEKEERDLSINFIKDENFYKGYLNFIGSKSSLLKKPIELSFPKISTEKGSFSKDNLKITGPFDPGYIYNVSLNIKDINDYIPVLKVGNFTTCSNLDLFLNSKINFGLNSNSKVKANLRISQADNSELTSGGLPWVIKKYKPRIIIVAEPLPLLDRGIPALKDFLESGGAVYYTTNAPADLNKLILAFANYTPTPVIVGTANVKTLSNLDHPILNGPFGNIQNRSLGESRSNAYSISVNEKLKSNFNLLSTYQQAGKETTLALAHKQYKLVIVGDGGNLFGTTSTRCDTSLYPFATSENGDPMSQKNFGVKKAEVDNSFFFANSMAWFINK